MLRLRSLAPVVAISVLLSGCGSGASPRPSVAVPSGAVQVEAKEYSFSPASISVAAGPVTFSVRNAGTQEHEFKILNGDAVVAEEKGLAPGLTKNVTLTLEPGTYAFMCKLNGHDQLGMKGTLTAR